MNPYFETELLHDVTSKGLKKFWKGFAVTDGVNFYTQSESWQLKADGTESKHIISAPNRSTVKNKGKLNEVSPREQAKLEILSKFESKRDTGYNRDGESGKNRRILPMTAHKFADRKHNIMWPAFAQPKLDGTRMLSDTETSWTRYNKNYIKEVVAHIQSTLPDGVVLDGELMMDQDKFTFQETISSIKKYRPGISDNLQYHVYDLYDANNPEMPFEERYVRLGKLVEELNNPFIRLVDTIEIQNEDELEQFHNLKVELGYEGAIVRNKNGTYSPGKRSAHLQKYKVFFDEEFTIMGAEDGEGKYEGCVTWICVAPNGGEVRVVPKGTIEEKQKWWTDWQLYVGKDLTVRHFGHTDDGSLRHPVGVSIRDYE